IDLWVTANMFKAGHRIRLEISSSNFPRFDRNPNSGNRFGTDIKVSPATQSVHHSKEYPSHILLPIIPN
ncbi:MAG TPA: CocE/NonD family hydrolase, partial [Verrucomicrobiales bacterium]|nr:CocE/NonD family hydrolase [Verrucomicrobiales bacterium]